MFGSESLIRAFMYFRKRKTQSDGIDKLLITQKPSSVEEIPSVTQVT